MAEEDILRMENLILALAYAPGKSEREGEPLRGKTVLQKLLFHLNRSLEPDKPAQEVSHFYGPFSEQAEVVAEQLEASGYLRIDEGIVKLTDRGMKEAERVWQTELGPKEKRIIKDLKSYFADLSVDEILALTYAKYPESAVDSLVRKELEKRGKELAVSLVRRGKVSMSLGAKIAQMPLEEFMRELSRRGISVIEQEGS